VPPLHSHEFSQEVSALKAIHDLGGHPCIAGVEAMYEDAKHYFLVEELVEGGEMFEHLCENGAYSEAKAAMLLRDLALGLDFLHSNDLVHADLKPENLMLSSWNIDDARVKLVDFGCCGARNSPSPQSVGTMAYWPPEALESYARGETIQLTPELDCWAAGVVLFIMLTGTHPFDPDGRTSEKEILRRAVHESVPLDDETCSHLTSSAKDLIGRLCTKDPAKRMTAREMILHPWVRGISANEEVMSGSDQKLGRFQAALKHRLETGVFCMLMQQQRLSSSGSSSEGAEVGEAIDVLKKAFEAFDVEKKGFVNASDIARVLSESGEEGLTSTEKEELAQGTADINVSTFEALMAELGEHKAVCQWSSMES
jgi:serine/threonine protein kinase